MAFTLHLSTGWIEAFRSKLVVEPEPLLQVIEINKMPPTPKTENLHRVLVSDGVHSLPALLHPQLQVIPNIFQNCVIRVLEYTRLDLPCGVVLALSKVVPVLQLPQVIGSPLLRENRCPAKISSAPHSKLSSDLQRILPLPNRQTNFSDVTILAGGAKFNAHKMILSARSSYFHALFLNGMNETGAQEIELCCDADIFQQIMSWVYTDDYDAPAGITGKIEETHIWKLYEVANFFCLETLVARLELDIIRLLSVENICYFWNHIHQMENPVLNSACKQFFIQHLSAIVPTLGFLSLEKALVLKIFFGHDDSRNTVDPSLLVYVGLGDNDFRIEQWIRDTSLTNFRPTSPAYKTMALTRWFAAHSPQNLKRKLQESFPVEESCKKKRLCYEESCTV